MAAQLACEMPSCCGKDPVKPAEAVQSGSLDASRSNQLASLAVAGLAWLGAGAPSVEREMIGVARSVRREISLCACSVTPGAMRLLAEVEDVDGQGVRATLLVNSSDSQMPKVQDYPGRSARALGEHWGAVDFSPRGPHMELHARTLVVQRLAALACSTSLSYRGVVSNHELAAVIRGPTAESIASRVDFLLRGRADSR